MSFRIASVEDFFKKAVNDAKVIGKFLAAHQAQIDETAKISVAIVSAVDPAIAPLATLIENAGEDILAKLITGIQSSGAGTAQKGMSTTFDAGFVSEVQALIQLIEKVNPGSTKPPAGLATSTVASIAA